MIRSLAETHGIRGLARLWDIDHAHISRMVSGENEPGDKVLDALGLESRTVYIRKSSKRRC